MRIFVLATRSVPLGSCIIRLSVRFLHSSLCFAAMHDGIAPFRTFWKPGHPLVGPYFPTSVLRMYSRLVRIRGGKSTRRSGGHTSVLSGITPSSIPSPASGLKSHGVPLTWLMKSASHGLCEQVQLLQASRQRILLFLAQSQRRLQNDEAVQASSYDCRLWASSTRPFLQKATPCYWDSCA